MSTAAAGEPRLPWFVYLLHHFRPREGWAILLLGWLAVLCLPAAALEGGMVAGLEPAITLASLGLLGAWWTAHQPWRGYVAAGVLLLAGVGADLLWGVHVVAPWPLVVQSVRRLDWWLVCGMHGRCDLPAPAITFFADQSSSVVRFAERTGWWVNGVVTGQGVQDNLVLIGVAGLISWSVAAWAGWWLARHGRPLPALLPTGVLLAQQAYYTEQGLVWLLIFVVLVPVLLCLVKLYWLSTEWDAAGVDYSGELKLEMSMVAVGISALVLVLSPALPFLSSQEASRAFWRLFAEPWQEVEERMERSFPGIQQGRSLVPPGGVAEGGLPRAHLLGGRPELGREVALRVRVRGAQPDDVLRWRGQTFAHYDGRGWYPDRATATAQEEGYLLRDHAAGEAWAATQPAGRHPVLSSVQVQSASRAVVYAAGEPVSVDLPYQAVLRAADELVALRIPRLPAGYTALGVVSDQDARALRTADTDYPPQVRELYLELPDDLPADVPAFAHRITANTATPYDAALAIESALRQMSYSLDVPSPPAGRELVSWFLFDLKRGYCDYFASAMVVLARASGIPARLAVGYAQGNYDAQSGEYVVTELEAHSWPELYFPAYGWVPFEPTPAQQVPARANLNIPEQAYPPIEPLPPDVEGELSALRQRAQQQAAETARNTRVQRLLFALNVLAAVLVAWRWLRPVSPTPAEGPVTWYTHLMQWGARLGRPARAAETPREYVAALSLAAEAAAGRAFVARRAAARQAAAVVRADAPRLAQAFEAARFAPESAPEEKAPNENRRWASLLNALRRLWLAAHLRL